MGVIEKATTSMRKASKHHNIPLTLLFNHLYGKKKSMKVRPIGILIVEEYQVVLY
jgi:hypothetical protein